MDDQLLGALLSAFDSVSGELFGAPFNRAKFGEINIMIKKLPPLIICYIYKLDSFLAQQRLDQLSAFLHQNDYIWNQLIAYAKTCEKVTTIPGLNLTIDQIFKSSSSA